MTLRRSAEWCLVAETPERRAFVLYVLLLLYVTVMRAAPAARRPGIRSRVYVQIRFESGEAVIAGIAWPETAQEAYLKHWLSVPHPCRSGRTMESRMIKLAWKFMRMQACGDSCFIASVLQAAR